MNELIDWAKNNPGVEKVCLSVHANNERAINLYKSLGFVQEGYLKKDLRFPDGSYIDTVLMAMDVTKL